MSFDDTTPGLRVLITGAAQGIGLATARLFARRRARVALADVKTEVAAAAAEIPSAVALQADLTDTAATRALAGRAAEALGGLDVLVNNAGLEFRAPFGAHPEADWRRLMAVNLDAPFLLSQAALPHLRDGGGAIVNVCSVAVAGIGGQAAYDASKGGLLSLSRSMAVELAPQGVRVNAVCPGWAETPMTAALAQYRDHFLRNVPLARACAPDEIAEAIVWLASPAAGYVTGQSLHVDGGWLRA